MLTARWIILSLVFSIGIANSQEQPPRNPNPKKVTQQDATDNRGTEKSPLVVKTLSPEKSTERIQEERTREHEKANREERLVFWTLALAILTGVLASVAGAQLWMFFRQLRLMKDGADDAKLLAKAAKKSADAVMLAERAYVKMSHVPPGIEWHEPDGVGFSVVINVKNYGRTPTTVTDVVLCIKVLPNAESLPAVPGYSVPQREEIPGAFLMPNDWFNYTRSFNLFERLDDVKHKKSSKLYVYGYVDYIDVFNQRQRGGYARVFNRWLDIGKQNNLVLVTQRGYNYDRQREEGEGNDWGALSGY